MKKCKTCKWYRIKGESGSDMIGKCDHLKVNEYIQISIELFLDSELNITLEKAKGLTEKANKYQNLRWDGEFGCIFHEESEVEDA